MDQDGIDDIGLWVPDRAGVAPVENGEWYFLVSQLRSAQDKASATDGTVNSWIMPFTPVPFGKDIYASFGDEFAVPVLGNFDPPVTAGRVGDADRGDEPGQPLRRQCRRPVDALDALILINDINANGQRTLTYGTLQAPFLDVTRDGAGLRRRRAGRDQRRQWRPRRRLGWRRRRSRRSLRTTWLTAALPATTSAVAAADSLTGVQYAGLLAEPLSPPSAGCGPVRSGEGRSVLRPATMNVPTTCPSTPATWRMPSWPVRARASAEPAGTTLRTWRWTTCWRTWRRTGTIRKKRRPTGSSPDSAGSSGGWPRARR